jgi:hypothetical protein
MTRFLAALRNGAPELALDGIGIAGAAAFSYGAWLAYPPSGFMAGGALLIIGAWYIARSN